MTDSRPLPDLLSSDERNALKAQAEQVWRDLQENNLGGFSYGNRPFWLMHQFELVIEKYGRRDIGLCWSPLQINAAREAALIAGKEDNE